MSTDEICALSLRSLAGLLRGRELSSREATRAHLDRIERVNPGLGAIVTLDAEGALARAAAADEKAAAGGELPPLHGVPMTHKDTHDVAGMRSTMGSPLHADRVPERSSLVVDSLQRAGVVSTGKSNVPEFGAGSHTFNPVFGLTVNPWAPGRSAAGSSGGAAAAIAAGVQAAGDASDMGGSIRTPASFTNLVGLRPSLGRVPRWPAEDPWAWLTRFGPLAREASDLALMMTVLSRGDVDGPVRASEPASVFERPLAEDLTGVRVGWSPDFGLGVPVDPEVLAVAGRQLAVFEAAGAVVEEACPDLSDADEVFRATRAFDFSVTFEEAYRATPERFKPSLANNIQLGLALTSGALRSALHARARLHLATTAFFHRYDLLITPAAQVPPFDARLEYPTEVAGAVMPDYLGWMRAATLISATGLPCVSVPAGFTDGGLPVGLQIVAPPDADLALLDAAHALELRNRFHERRPDLTGLDRPHGLAVGV